LFIRSSWDEECQRILNSQAANAAIPAGTGKILPGRSGKICRARLDSPRFPRVVSDRLQASLESDVRKTSPGGDAGVRSPVVPSRTLPSVRDFSHCGSVRTFGDVLEVGIAALRFKRPKIFIFRGFPPLVQCNIDANFIFARRIE
jgi:hypothetical protein